MSPTSAKQRGKTNPELKRSRSQGTQRKLVKAQSVASTEDPNYGGGAVSTFFSEKIDVSLVFVISYFVIFTPVLSD